MIEAEVAKEKEDLGQDLWKDVVKEAEVAIGTETDEMFVKTETRKKNGVGAGALEISVIDGKEVDRVKEKNAIGSVRRETKNRKKERNKKKSVWNQFKVSMTKR